MKLLHIDLHEQSSFKGNRLLSVFGSPTHTLPINYQGHLLLVTPDSLLELFMISKCTVDLIVKLQKGIKKFIKR